MRISKKELLGDLKERTTLIQKEATTLKNLPSSILHWNPRRDAWNIVQCIEHLNRYGYFYIPELESKIQSAKQAGNHIFRSGLLGNYFAKSMLPKENLYKMSTFKNMNPINSPIQSEVIDTFINQQNQILDILSSAEQIDLNTTKTTISISKWINLKIGDTLRILIYHNQRHMVQIKNIRASYPQ